jgi:hypothetical protein
MGISVSTWTTGINVSSLIGSDGEIITLGFSLTMTLID